jgi:hypothetical protein
MHRIERSPRNRTRWRWIVLCLLPSLALAQAAGGAFVMRKQVVAGGGAQNTGTSYRLVGTVAQPGAHLSAAGSYRLTGGFHTPAQRPDRLLCDGFENTPCP